MSKKRAEELTGGKNRPEQDTTKRTGQRLGSTVKQAARTAASRQPIRTDLPQAPVQTPAAQQPRQESYQEFRLRRAVQSGQMTGDYQLDMQAREIRRSAKTAGAVMAGEMAARSAINTVTDLLPFRDSASKIRRGAEDVRQADSVRAFGEAYGLEDLETAGRTYGAAARQRQQKTYERMDSKRSYQPEPENPNATDRTRGIAAGTGVAGLASTIFDRENTETPSAYQSTYDAIQHAQNEMDYWYRAAEDAAEIGDLDRYRYAAAMMQSVREDLDKAGTTFRATAKTDLDQRRDAFTGAPYRAISDMLPQSVRGAFLEQNREHAGEVYHLADYFGDADLQNDAKVFGNYTGFRGRELNAERLQRLEAENPALYLAVTMSATELEDRLASLEAKPDPEAVHQEIETWQQTGGIVTPESLGVEPEQLEQTYEENAEIQQTRAALEIRQRMELSELAQEIVQRPNFEAKAAEGKSKSEADTKAKSTFRAQSIISATPLASAIGELMSVGQNEDLTAQDLSGSDRMTAEETQIYYAIYADDPETAHKWAQSCKRAHRDEFWNDAGSAENRWYMRPLEFLGGTALKFASGLDPYGDLGQWASQAGGAMLTKVGTGLEQYGAFNSGHVGTEHLSDLPVVGKDLAWFFGDKGAQDVVALGSSMLQSKAIAAVAAASGDAAPVVKFIGTAIMGSSAAADDYREMLNAGWSESEAVLHSFAVGVWEAGFEYWSLDKFINAPNDPGFRNSLKRFLIQGGIEASEELCTTLAGRVSDAVLSAVSGNDNYYDRALSQYLQNGVSYEEAVFNVRKDIVVEALCDALGGFISGSLSSGARDVVNSSSRIVRNASNQLQAFDSMGDFNYDWTSGDYFAEQDAEAVSRARPKATTRDYRRLGQQSSDATTVEALSQYAKDNDIAWQAAKTDTGKRGQAALGRNAEAISNHMAAKMIETGDLFGGAMDIYYKAVDAYGDGIQPTAARALSAAAGDLLLKSAQSAQELARRAAAIEDPKIRRAIYDGLGMAVTGDRLESDLTQQTARAAETYGTAMARPVKMEAIVTDTEGKEATVGIKGFSSDGSSVVLDDGTEVAVSALQADADTKDVLQAISNAKLGSLANVVFKAYMAADVSGSYGSYRWIAGYVGAINQGITHSITVEQAVEQNARMFGLDEETVRQAYGLGETLRNDPKVQARKQGLQKAVELAKEKGVKDRNAKIDQTRIQGIKISGELQAHITAVNQIAKAVGVDIVWFSSKNADGSYSAMSGKHADGTIWLDIESGKNNAGDVAIAILGTMSHELTHFIQQYSNDLYMELQDLAMQHLRQQLGEDGLEQLILDTVKKNGFTSDNAKVKAMEELAAQFCEKMFSMEESMQPVLADVQQNHKGLWAKIKEFFRGFIEKVRKLIEQGETADKSIALQVWESISEEMQKVFAAKWGEALSSAKQTHDAVTGLEAAGIQVEGIKNTAQEGGEEQYQNRPFEYMKPFAEQVKDFMDKSKRASLFGRGGLLVGTTPKILQDIGLLKMPIGISQRHVSYSIEGTYARHSKHPEFVNDHIFDPDEFAKLPEKLAEPIAVTADLGKKKLVVYVEMTNKGGKQTIVPFSIGNNMSIGGNELQLQTVDSVHGNTDAENDLRASILGDSDDRVRLYYLNEKKIPLEIRKAIQVDGHPIPNGIIHSITEKGSVVKPAFSSLTDTMQFKRWFKKSKIVDEHGAPKIVYHQTGADFWRFSTENPVAGRNDSETPNGIFFKDNDHDIGIGGTRQMAVYLSVQNPLHFANREAANKWYQKHIDGYAELQKEMQEKIKPIDDYLEQVEQKMFGEDVTDEQYDAFDVEWNAKLEEMRVVEDDYRERLREMLNSYFLNGNSQYDGIILDYDGHRYVDGKRENVKTYIVFKGTQVKSATDNIGMFDPENEDIRYQTRPSDTVSDVELVMGMKESDAATREGKALIREAQAKQKQIEALQAKLEDARRQLTTTQRALNTKGIGDVVKNVTVDFEIADPKGTRLRQRATAILTEAYREALNQIDKGASAAEAWDTVYNGAVKAAELLLTEGRYTQNVGGTWTNIPYERYIGEERQQVIDQTVAAVAQDFAMNRYRDAIQETAADRLVARTEKRMQQKVDNARADAADAKARNEQLEKDNAFLREQADAARKTAGDIYLEVQDLRQELKDNKRLSAKDRRSLQDKIKNRDKTIAKKRAEAQAWQQRAERNASLMKSAMESKNRDIAKLEKEIQKHRDILAGKLRNPQLTAMLKDARKAVYNERMERFTQYRESRKATELRSRIGHLKQELSRSLTKPTDARYMPAGLATALVDALDTIDNSPAEGTKAAAKYASVSEGLRALAAAYDKLTDEGVDFVYRSEYDADIKKKINQLAETLQGRNLRELSAAELQQVYDQIKQIRDIMRDATKTMSSQVFGSLYDAMRAVAVQQNGMKSLNSLTVYQRSKRNKAMHNLSVMRAVEMMSNWDRNAALYQLMHAVEKGVVDADTWVMQYNKSLQDLKTGKNEKAYRDALTKKLDYGVTDDDGAPVKMTKLQALQLLMTAEREAHNDKLVHLKKGGATIRDALAIQDGKANRAKEQHIAVTPELLQTIRDSLTDWDRAYMKAIRDYFAKEGKATNRIHYQLKHKVLQTEDYYVPIAVDKNYLDTNLDEAQAMTMWVRTPGSTNELQQKSQSPVIIDGLDTVMGRHVREIADYICLALPVRDFSKVYNGRLQTGEDGPALPVKQTINRTFGTNGQHLLTQAIIDVQGGRRSANWNTAIGEFLNFLQRAFVKTALLVNPSVTIKQAASYTAAESILSYRALVAGNRPILNATDVSKSPTLIAQIFAAPEGKTARRIYDEIDAHTSMHYQRRLGMSMVELANEANRSGPVKRWMNSVGASMEQSTVGHAVRKAGEMMNPVTWIQRMDVATTAAIWVACKEQAKMDGKTVGTEEYWNYTTELYERCLRETQPMYDGLHRSAHQKEEGLVSYLFPFRTVPIQNHGQIAASWETLQAARQSKDQTRIKAAERFFAKTMKAQLQSAIIFATMSFIAAALKRKTKKYRDEEGEIDILSILQGIAVDVGSTMFSNVLPLGGSAIWDTGTNIIDSVKTGKKVWGYDSFSIGPVDLLNAGIRSMGDLITDGANLLAGREVSKETFLKHVEAAAFKTLMVLGIPAETVKTYTKGTIGNIQDLLAGRLPALNNESWDRTTAQNTSRYWKAWQDGDSGKASAVLEEMRRNYTANGKSAEDADAAARTALAKPAMEAYDAGDITLDQLHDYLVGTGLYSDKQLTDKIIGLVHEELKDGAISTEDAVTLLQKYNPDLGEDDAWWKVREWSQTAAHAADEDYSYSLYKPVYEVIDANGDIEPVVREMVAHGKDETDLRSGVKAYLVQKYIDDGRTEDWLKNTLSRYCGIVNAEDVSDIVNDANCKRDSGVGLSSLGQAYRSNTVDAATAKRMLVTYGGLSAGEASNRVRYWDFQNRYPDANISQEKLDAYYDKKPDGYGKTMQEAGISVDVYVRYAQQAATATGTDLDGDGKTDSGTKKAAILEVIDSLPLTGNQKDGLYYLNGWSAKTINEAPWH